MAPMVNNTNDRTSFIWSIAEPLRGPYAREPAVRCGVEAPAGCNPARVRERGVRRPVRCRPAADLRRFLPLPSAHPESDSELRDTENVPLKEDIGAYVAREVLPHVPDAWIDEAKTRDGYDIPFNRHFYTYAPPRPLEEIEDTRPTSRASRATSSVC